MKILLDINIVLDVVMNRQPWVDDSERIWELHRTRRVTAYLAAFSLPTVFYIARRQLGVTEALSVIDDCLATFDLLPTDRATVQLARTFQASDFEDCLQAAAAVTYQLDAIVSRDQTGFANLPITVFTPLELLANVMSSR